MNRSCLAFLIVLASAGWSVSAPCQTIARPIPVELAQRAPLSVLGPADAAIAFRPGSGATLTPPSGASAVYTIDVPRPSRTARDVAIRWTGAEPIAAGDVLLVRMMVRALKARQESGEAEVAITYQDDRAPFERSLVTQFSFGLDWTLLEIPFTATKTMMGGESELVLGFGGLEQTVELTGVEVLNFQTRAPLASLPATRFTYPGREDGAAWREAALARIDEIRTAPLTIKVVGPDGQPLSGVSVAATLTQPSFLWGAAVGVGPLRDPSADGERYRRELLSLFDTVTIDNALKWPEWQNESRGAETLETLDWLNAQGLRVRGHNLIWPGWKWAPASIRDAPDHARLQARTNARVTEAVMEVGPRVMAWDVVNEPLHEDDFFDHMPRIDGMAEWFRLARAANPDADLAINDYGMLNRSNSPLVVADYVSLIEQLRAAGAPIDVVGIQGHVGQQPRPPESVLSDLDLLRPLGLPVQITEFDINTRDEALQADYYRDFLIAIYSHPVVNGFVQWGFWQEAHWKPDAALYRGDWSERPALAVWRDLVLGRWRTRVAGRTDAAGRLETRGHLGRYRITATSGGRALTQEIDLTAAGATAALVLP